VQHFKDEELVLLEVEAMVGSTAQIAALACYLNAHMRGIACERFFPEHSTCVFCEWVHFLRPRRRLFRRNDWSIACRTPDEWIDSMVSEGFARALLLHQPVNGPGLSDRVAAGFVGGGGRWLLAVEGDDSASFWEARWKTGNRQAADKRIWRAEYGLVAQGPLEVSTDCGLGEITAQLEESLAQIEAFARRKNLGGFADSFAKARQCLVADDPLSLVYHTDLAPAGTLEIEALRLLAAVQAGWVFGCMGSWNDLVFGGEDEVDYDQLSEHLFTLINQAICAAVNASAPK
jgi:hypothetical protein